MQAMIRVFICLWIYLSAADTELPGQVSASDVEMPDTPAHVETSTVKPDPTTVKPPGLVAAGGNFETTACALNVAVAVDQALDAAVYIWAATSRCGKGKDLVLKCEIDVMSAIQAVAGTVDNIVAMLGACGYVHFAGSACATSVGQLSSATAGMAAASGKIAEKCPKHGQGSAEGDILQTQLGLGKCLVDVAGSARNLFKAITRIKDIVEDCGDPLGRVCLRNEMNILSAVASLGAFANSAVDNCEMGKKLGIKIGNEKAGCAGAVLSLIGDLGIAGKSGLKVSDDCVPTARLYNLREEERQPVEPSVSSKAITFSLVLLLPVTAVLSFVGGSRFAWSRGSKDETSSYGRVQGESALHRIELSEADM